MPVPPPVDLPDFIDTHCYLDTIIGLPELGEHVGCASLSTLAKYLHKCHVGCGCPNTLPNKDIMRCPCTARIRSAAQRQICEADHGMVCGVSFAPGGEPDGRAGRSQLTRSMWLRGDVAVAARD